MELFFPSLIYYLVKVEMLRVGLRWCNNPIQCQHEITDAKLNVSNVNINISEDFILGLT